jgi:predicted Zn-dependent protease
MSGFSNHRVLILVAAALLLAGCATSPTGRSQLQFFSEAEMAQMGDKAFEQTRKKTPTVQDPAVVNYVKCVVDALAVAVPAPEGGGSWQVTVFREDTANAFALPGGHIGVYTGIFDVARTPAELAAVIGHEIGHLMAHHPNARLSAEYATQSGLQLIGMLADGETAQSRQLMSLLGLGAQVGVILPFSRAQESEADTLGLRYMAEAGFDPREAIQLWQNMMAQGGTKPPGFLSTHPTDEARIHSLEKQMPAAMDIYQQARAQGRSPQCSPPP